MLKSYITIALRNITRNKVYSAINIVGLAIGMAACFFIFLYVRFEKSYDRFHKNADRLYRISMSYYGSAKGLATTHPAVGPAMKADFPEVVEFARLAKPTTFSQTSTMWYTNEKGEKKIFNEANFYIADAAFISMFSFPFIAGNPAKALEAPQTIVISESIAKKYIGTTNALDKVLVINQMPLKITGVFKDLPQNSHIKFDMLTSFATAGEKWGYTEWGWPEFYNYVMLAPDADLKKLEAKLPAFTEKYLAAKMKEFNFRAKFSLQPVTDIHLKSGLKGEPEPAGSERTVYFLSVLGILTLVIAWINYINLSTAKSMERAREVGLRKMAGATRPQVIRQFIFESFLVNCFALFIAIALIIGFAPLFDQLTGKKITAGFLNSGLMSMWKFWLVAALIFIAGAIQVGMYPAFLLSAFSPALVLKGKFLRSNKGITLRRILVSGQFVLSILLIAGSIIVYRQLSFMRNQQLGYNINQIAVIKAPAVFDSTFTAKAQSFKTALQQHPAIVNIAPSTEIPGKTIWARNTVRRFNQDRKEGFVSDLIVTDHDFIPTYNMQLAAGNNLPNQPSGNVFETLNTKALVNEQAAKMLGYNNINEVLNQKVLVVSWFGDITCEIVGVIKDFHQRSLKDPILPMLYYQNDSYNWAYFSINMNTKDAGKTLAFIKAQYDKFFPGNAFESFFLDEYFNRQYQDDERFGDIFALFTILAIVIACLGLIGLSTFAIKLRTKEIGVRKVLGATVHSIVYLLFSDFIRLVCISGLIAVPVVYFTASKWLSNFAYHIQLGWFVFILAPALLIIIAFITVSIQSIRAALANPVKALRSE
ncbi:ABC transporter permease [Longitalea luteola]|uniref:ABC transporter permease n=1 Tax=Longitalea luteola TaxID=2812563 RepID=UPI001A97C976|nr:ABC transporter permease [Longitalea luteola]